MLRNTLAGSKTVVSTSRNPTVFLRSQTLRSLTRTVTPQKMMLAGSPSPKSLKTAPQRWTKVKNSARRFGHRAVRSQTPQTCFSRDLWPPILRWLNLPSVQQSFSFTFFHNLQRCGMFAGGLAGMFLGSNSAKIHPAKFHPAKDSAKHPKNLKKKKIRRAGPGTNDLHWYDLKERVM